MTQNSSARFSLIASIAAVSFVVLSSYILRAQDTTPKTDAGSQKMMKSPDTKFALAAAQGGFAEVQMGQLAAQKATNPEVKAFGQQMVDDHTKANDQLKQVASSEDMTLPDSMGPKEQTEYTKLQNLSGAQFDHAYVHAMVKDHEEDVKEFHKEANTGKDPQIKNFASTTLPILQGHLDKIKGIQANMGGATSR